MLAALGSKEAEMKIIGCDLHAAQQTILLLDRETGEVVEKTPETTSRATGRSHWPAGDFDAQPLASPQIREPAAMLSMLVIYAALS
jgi:hypothetical protein